MSEAISIENQKVPAIEVFAKEGLPTEALVKEGYKKTKLGWIPEDWDLIKLEELTTKISDGIHTTPTYSNKTSYFFINGNNLIKNKIVITENTKCVDKKEYLKHQKDLTERTILLSINGTIGNIAFYANENVVLGKSVAFLNIKISVSKEYISYQLQAHKILSHFKKLVTGSTIKNLGIGSIKNTKIPLPPLPEQEKIAATLSSWDNAIGKQEQLIAAKQHYKKGLMQLLLTGKKRFEGFDEGWEEVKLGEVTTINPQLKALPDKFIYIDLESVKSGKLVKRNLILKENAPSRAQRLLKISDILFQTVRPYQKNNLFYESDEISVASSGYAQIRTNQNSRFIFHLLHTEVFVNKVLARCTGTSFPAISPTDLKKIKINLPTIDEQKKIASVLSAADKEIVMLQKQFTGLMEQKRGLIQNLLTGNIRIEL
jgi:type I restriction enzyme S subunit